jgi:phosphate transport system substrate-binding protein
MDKIRTRAGITMLAVLLVAAACGGGTTSPPPGTANTGTTAPGTPVTSAPAQTSGPATDAPSEAPGSLTGNVQVHGSSTVAPISTAVAEDFQALNPEWTWFVGEEGTGDGFELFFCVGDADISDASRAITEEEVTLCQDNGVEYVELQVAFDGLAVITHPDNPIECLTTADLYALMGPESDDVRNWNDAEALAHQLGSTTDLPDAALSITAPGDESGTYDSFVELALGDHIEAQGTEERLRTPGDIYVASASDNVVIDGVAGFPTSLGFVGLAYVTENPEAVKTIAVDAGEGCVQPSNETVIDGSYAIARPLFVYPSLTRMADNPAIAPFVDFYLSDEGIANVSDVGYVPLPEDILEENRSAWETAKSGG